MADQIPVSAITVTGANSATSIFPDSTLDMIATVSPSDASDIAITWSINPAAGFSIDQTGLLSTTSPSDGAVTVTATAQDGSNVSGSEQITLDSTGGGGGTTSVPVTSIAVTGAGLATSVPDGEIGRAHV